MGQQDVFDFLKEHKSKWFKSTEIAAALDLSMGSVTSNLKKLRKSNSVKYRTIGNLDRFEYCHYGGN